MEKKRKYHYQISTQHIDFQKKVTLSSLFHLILKTAGKDADNNGFGLLKLQSDDYTWVLSRFVMDIERLPLENEEITIETWIQDVGAMFTTRNFRIMNGENKLIAYASSSWAVINMQTREGVLLDTLPLLNDFILSETTPIGVPTRIANVKGNVANRFEVKYSHIDVNRHASSPFYIQWIADCFSLDFYLTNKLKRFEINFLKEITFGDTGEVYQEMKSENDYYFQITTQEKGIACRARMVFL
ncbi:MAG: thioesterase [Bacteroidia bacterium]|nr:thioesterase [Bacteroidia bacterium]